MNSPWFSQNREVSVSSGSMVTRNFSFDSAVRDLGAIGGGQQRVEALAEIAVHLALVHQLEGAQNVVAWHVELRQPVIGEVVFRRRRVAPHRLLEADEELLVVLPVADLVRAATA